MTKPPIPNGVAVVPLARRAKWAQKHTEHDPPDRACPVCGAPRQRLDDVEQATCGQPTCEATAAGRLLR